MSTEEQNPENQIAVLSSWCSQQGYTITATYQDIMSGARRRERLDDLFEDARHHQFDIVAIWSLDRLTREGPLATLLYIHRLNAMGVKVFSHQEPYLDPRLPFYESIIALLADIAKWERQRLSERTKAGMERAARSGKHCGRPSGSKDRKKRSKKGGVKSQIWKAISGPAP